MRTRRKASLLHRRLPRRQRRRRLRWWQSRRRQRRRRLRWWPSRRRQRQRLRRWRTGTRLRRPRTGTRRRRTAAVHFRKWWWSARAKNRLRRKTSTRASRTGRPRRRKCTSLHAGGARTGPPSCEAVPGGRRAETSGTRTHSPQSIVCCRSFKNRISDHRMPGHMPHSYSGSKRSLASAMICVRWRSRASLPSSSPMLSAYSRRTARGPARVASRWRRCMSTRSQMLLAKVP
mmetsp:Transcript_28155/g.91957  ORF Transcript_28155/g.91957 Transcript_28155/m.91957 type:complete len:232 (-) Transcript_28155:1702-2397(-)